jgi:hypothetical protein
VSRHRVRVSGSTVSSQSAAEADKKVGGNHRRGADCHRPSQRQDDRCDCSHLTNCEGEALSEEMNLHGTLHHLAALPNKGGCRVRWCGRRVRWRRRVAFLGEALCHLYATSRGGWHAATSGASHFTNESYDTDTGAVCQRVRGHGTVWVGGQAVPIARRHRRPAQAFCCSPLPSRTFWAKPHLAPDFDERGGPAIWARWSITGPHRQESFEDESEGNRSVSLSTRLNGPRTGESAKGGRAGASIPLSSKRKLRATGTALSSTRRGRAGSGGARAGGTPGRARGGGVHRRAGV